MSLSKNVQEMLLATGTQYSQPYSELATKLAVVAAGTKAIQAKAKDGKATLWDLFKSALAIAAENGHTETAIRVGLEIACESAKVPKGSYRSYVMTVGSMYAEILAGTLDAATAVGMSVADARKRYKTVTPEEAMREKIKEATKDWNAEQLALLLSLISDVAAETAESNEEDEETQDEARTGTDG